MTNLIKFYLIFQAVFFQISSFLYALEGDTDKWFSRMFVSLIALGFLYVGSILEKGKED